MSETLAQLAYRLEPTSPGFAARILAFRDELAAAGGSDLERDLATIVARILEAEGPAREMGFALLGAPIQALLRIGGAGLAVWLAALDVLRRGGATRAAQLFSAAALDVLVETPAAEVAGRLERLTATAHGLAALMSERVSDPAFLRFAAAAGRGLGFRGAPVLVAWGRWFVEVSAGGRRFRDVELRLPVGGGLSDEELAAFFEIAATVATVDRVVASRLGTETIEAFGAVPADARAPLLGVLHALAHRPALMADVLAVCGPVLRRLVPSRRARVLAVSTRLAAAVPAATPPFLRTVLRVLEALGEDAELDAFVEEGLAEAEVSPAAAEAFFALETRGARAFLKRHDAAVHFEDVERTLRGYAHVLTDQRQVLVPREFDGLLPAILDEEGLPVAERAAHFPVWEENFTLLKLQVSLALRWEAEGTRRLTVHEWKPDAEVAGGLTAIFAHFTAPQVAAGLFAQIEAVRLGPALARELPGLAADLRPLRQRLFPNGRPDPAQGAPPALLFLALGGPPADIATLDSGLEALRAFADQVAAGRATPLDSLRLTERFCALLEAGELVRIQSIETLFEDDPMLTYLLEEGSDRPSPGSDQQADFPPPGVEHTPRGQRSDELSDAPRADLALLRAFLERNPEVTVLRSDGTLDPMGLFVTGLMGSGVPKAPGTGEASGASALPPVALARPGQTARGIFLHDEWDWEIEGYRAGWCQVHEIVLEGEDASFFTEALDRHAALLPEVRRQFQRVPPEGYRVIRGLLDGEDVDLNAAVIARADLRARVTPSARLYTARQREERDVATLFLLDVSASTDEEVEPAPDGRPGRRGRRVLDIQKEALAIMAQALEEIGDLYAIYGFSGHGRDRVEVFEVKSFDEALTLASRARIGALEPQRSTRMGAALRQAIRRLSPIPSRSRNLILLSDGFPQDFDYGRDRRSNLYGLRDTAQAIAEAERAGISTFCITVDRAGHDYLREMCPADRYLVIDDIQTLPRELPRIYSRATHGDVR